MHNTVTASESPSGTTSRSSRSGIPWNKPLVSGWSRIPQDDFRTHGKPPVTHHLAATLVMTPAMPQSECSRWPKSWCDHLWSRQDIRMPNWPYPNMSGCTQFGNFGSLNGFLDTWVRPVRVDPWSRWFWTILMKFKHF